MAWLASTPLTSLVHQHADALDGHIVEGAPQTGHHPRSYADLDADSLPRIECVLQKMSTRDNRKDQLQGTLDLLVLRTLSTGGTMHGYAISERVALVSRDTLSIEAGSLYPALHRMEEAGWVRSTWDTSDNNRRARFYTLTAAGRRRLAEEAEHWARLTLAVNRVLKQA